ncbi:MAG: TRAP transporter permease [Rhodospirillales bacterium]
MTDQPPAPAAQPLVRQVVSWLAGGLTVLCLLWVLEVPMYFGVAFFREQFLSPVLGISLCICYLHVAASGKAGGRTPWLDVVLAAAGLAVTLWVMIEYRWFLERVVGFQGWPAVVVGITIVVLVLEGLRRTSGYTMFFVVLAFIVYAFVGDLVPGPLKALPIEFRQLMIYLAFDPTAVFGVPLRIGAEVVIIFIFLGQLLLKTGGGEFFTDIAMALMGRQRGGAAKIAVVASALFGSISGSATSNVASTGVITIPLMRRSGYAATRAGAIEAVASTGGQLMPPVMGAAAFLMAEFLETSYGAIIVAAIIPAMLYYFAVFAQVDLVAARERIVAVAADIPRARDVMKDGWHFVLPFVVLLYLLFEENMDAEKAAIYACATIAVLGFLISYRGHRLNVRTLLACFVEAGIATVELALLMAAAGFVIGILNVTGLGFALTFFLVKLGGGNLALLLLIAAIACIILGMGMPTSGVYVLLASLIAPALSEAGIAPIAAHMFILYFGMMSMVTPPVALAAFTAAGLSGASPMQTGWIAMRMAWTAYIVPVLFVLSPSLLMRGEPVEVAIACITAVAGVYYVSVAFEGYFTRPLGPAMRLAFIVAGLAAITPASTMPYGEWVDVAGVLLGAAMLWRERSIARSERLRPPVAAK